MYSLSSYGQRSVCELVLRLRCGEKWAEKSLGLEGGCWQSHSEKGAGSKCGRVLGEGTRR